MGKSEPGEFMKSFSIILFLALLTAESFAAKPKKQSRLPASSDQELFVKQFPQPFEECDPENVSVLALDLRESLPERDDLLATCMSDCGKGGCPYQLYVFRDGHYQKTAEFFGFYEVTDVRHRGLADISVKSTIGQDLTSNLVLKFNGKDYE